VPAIRGFLLDIDGTLLDSNDAHAEAWERALTEAGFAVPFSRIRPLVGMGGDKVVPLLTGLSADSPKGERLQERRGEIFRSELLPALRPFPKARELLEELGRRRIRRVVATSASEDDMHALLEQAGVGDLMDETVTHDDVDRSKPDPDIVATALARVSLRPEQAMLVGDTPYDVEAALRARVPPIGVRSGGWRDNDLHGAVAVFDDVSELCAHLDDVLLSKSWAKVG
jgi:HAD superfamily hydrolase (TIGR01509 family)